MQDKRYLVVGKYTSHNDPYGIHIYSYTPGGEIQTEDLLLIENASYFTITPDRKYLYAVTENGEEPSYVYSFRLRCDGQHCHAEFINRVRTKGNSPCHITFDLQSQNLLVSNYLGGSVNVIPTLKDGALGKISQCLEFHGSSVNPNRQDKSYIHCCRISPDKGYLFICDLGADKIYRFHINRTAGGEPFIVESSLVEFAVTAGSGPRHLKFTPDGCRALLVNELSDNVMIFDYLDGNPDLIQTLCGNPVNAEGGADLQVHPSGNFAVASFRNTNDGIRIYGTHQQCGNFHAGNYINTDPHPRKILFTPDGNRLLVASMDQNTIRWYHFDHTTGRITPEPYRLNIARPVCMAIL